MANSYKYYTTEEVKAIVSHQMIEIMMPARYVAQDGDDYNTVIRFNSGIACYNEGIRDMAAAITNALDAEETAEESNGTDT